MGLTANDSDESIEDEISAPALGRGIAVGDSNSKSTIHLFLQTCDSGCEGILYPLWDSWNNCVNDDYTRERRYKDGDSVALSVTTRAASVSTVRCIGESHLMAARATTMSSFMRMLAVGLCTPSQARERSHTSAAVSSDEPRHALLCNG